MRAHADDLLPGCIVDFDVEIADDLGLVISGVDPALAIMWAGHGSGIQPFSDEDARMLAGDALSIIAECEQ